MSETNPLLNPDQYEDYRYPFGQIKEEHFLPALTYHIEQAEKELDAFKQTDTKVSFDTHILPIMEIGENVEWVEQVFGCLYSAHATDKLQSLAEQFQKQSTEFSKKFTLDETVFEKIKAVYDKREQLNLNPEQAKIVDKLYHDFARNGALLSPEDKQKLKEIDQELSKTGLLFSQNSLKATKQYELIIEDKKELPGLPDDLLAMAEQMAKAKGKSGYLFNLDYPSFIPFMKYCANRELRETIYRANGGKATHGEFDNREHIKKIVQLRIKRANLLGHKTHADFVLEKRMAKKPEKVLSFLDEIYQSSFTQAKNEVEELKTLAKELDGLDDLRPWDTSYYSEKLKSRKLEFDDQALKPYFEANRVLEGVFKVSEKLFNLKFTLNKEKEVYHQDVQVYDVTDTAGKEVGSLFVDLYPRETKRQGAWMMEFRGQGLFKKQVRRPSVAIVCNFSPATETRPSLLNLNEVTTLFHEFGHALHGLLSQCYYQFLSGTRVFWDFVELPSQIMENWVTEKECLDLFANHFETGEKIPGDLIDKIKKNNQFLEGMQTIRQLSFGLLDMGWHYIENLDDTIDVEAFEKKQMERAKLLEPEAGVFMSPSFGHIFAGGYSAGYYSYKWAEVLDADAFEKFTEDGIFNAETGDRFKKCILEKGGTEDPMKLFIDFRGREPSPKALMKRAGFVK
jgi:peptidyl-dipeptidase Dcp